MGPRMRDRVGGFVGECADNLREDIEELWGAVDRLRDMVVASKDQSLADALEERAAESFVSAIRNLRGIERELGGDEIEDGETEETAAEAAKAADAAE